MFIPQQPITKAKLDEIASVFTEADMEKLF